MKATSICARARIVLAVAASAAATALAFPAAAGCAIGVPESPAGNGPLTFDRAGLMSAVYHGNPGGFIRVDDRGQDRVTRGASIVGTWRFTWTSDGSAYPVPIPSGAVVDFGTQQWHDDGTEFIISGSRPPGSGDTCMGSWEQTGPSAYRFKHIALAWANGDSVPAATPAVYVGPAIMRAAVTLNRSRNAFEGTFTIDQYAKDEVTLLEHVSGRVTATRFSVD
jgi:hypothetical protein